ncbi:hypothetical protein GCM10011416_07300 [Polaribacter pacificus]|uniref:Lipoprotein n=1 Tax=Polaribacter pacificus TaxID=1775173 RepID=A0A917HWW6_9FLAO|nr:hypothetical protein [Polaribacter pacificus]GGG92825.1 hypothetical protein GCM10011416_07300 [Polaribacter pacificus]
MKKVQIFLLVLIAFSLSQCKTTQFEKQAPFTIQSATYNYWKGGQPNVGGTKVSFAYKATKPVEFDSIYFQQKSVKVELQEIAGTTYVVGFFNNSRNIPVVGQVKATEKKQSTPFQLGPNEAVLSYLKDGKIKYFKVSDLEEVSSNMNQ